MKWPVGEQITLSKSTCSSLTSVLTCSVILICRIGSCMHQSSGDTAGRDSTRQRDDGVRDSHRCALHLLFCEVENNLFLFIRALAEFEPVIYARLRQADSTNSSLRDNCCCHCCCCCIRAGPHLMLFTAAPHLPTLIICPSRVPPSRLGLHSTHSSSTSCLLPPPHSKKSHPSHPLEPPPPPQCPKELMLPC